MDQKDISLAPQTQRFEKKREAILGAAARLFNQKGVKGTTLADVAQSVALITNSVTYYYRKKEDLASASFLRTIDVFNRLCERASVEAHSHDRVRTLLRLYADLLAQIAHGDHADLMLFQDIRALRSPHVEIVFDAYTDMFRRMRALLGSRRQVAHGGARPALRLGSRHLGQPRSSAFKAAMAKAAWRSA